MEETFKRCGECENTCNCKTEAECGYLFDDGDNEYSACDNCGSDSMWETCWSCGGEGGTSGEELMMEDPLWYSEDDFRQCDICDGKGGYYVCIAKCHEKSKQQAT